MENEIDYIPAGIPKEVWDKVPEETKQKMKEDRALGEAIKGLQELLGVLQQDVQELYQFGKLSESDQAWRRSSYRAVFSWIEGVVYQMKQVALYAQGGYYQAKHSRAEIAYLKEEYYRIDKSGKVSTSHDRFVKIDWNLKFAHSQLVKAFNLSTELEVGRKGWEQFMKSIKIRNRITHPKTLADLNVSDNDMLALVDVINWFDKQVSNLVADIRATVEPILQKIRVEGAANIQSMYDHFMMVLERAKKVEDTIAIIDEMRLEDIDSGRKEKLEIARLKLDDLRKEIASDLVMGEK